MKKNLKNNLYILLPFFFFLVPLGCNQETKREIKGTTHTHQDGEYTCPMHPQVIQKEPGTCPVCGMDLVKKSGHKSDVAISDEMSYLLKPTNSVSISSISTTELEEETREVTTTAKGVITYDTRQAFTIPIRFGGRIEKLFIKYNFQSVRKGQKILEIYSPDLITAQRELLFLRKSDPGNTQLIEGAKQKLRLLGVSEKQIQQLVSTGKESYSFSVYSPYDGYVVEEAALSTPALSAPSNAATTNAIGMGDGMGQSTSGNSTTSVSVGSSTRPIQLREGMYLTTGQSVFKVINVNKLWAEFNIYQQDASNIKVDQPIQIAFDNVEKEPIKAKVDFIQPFFKEGESFTKLRVYLNNAKGQYKVGQLVTAHLNSKAKNAKWIPFTALVDLGTRTIVFVKKGEVFEAKKITPGQRSGDWIEVVDGLKEGDKIAYNGQFLTDSESFIRIN